MRDGNIVVNIETSNAWGEKVIQGSAEVSQSSTVYVFTGQGSKEPGMGTMDLYNSSPAARAVWEGADAHLLAVYGFSIVEIVKDYLAVHSTAVPKTLPGVTHTEVGNSVTFKFGSKLLPETESTGRLVPDFGWLGAQLVLCPGFFSYRCSRHLRVVLSGNGLDGDWRFTKT